MAQIILELEDYQDILDRLDALEDNGYEDPEALNGDTEKLNELTKDKSGNEEESNDSNNEFKF